MVAARSDAMSIGTIAKREVMMISREEPMVEAGNMVAMTTSKAVAMAVARSGAMSTGTMKVVREVMKEAGKGVMAASKAANMAVEASKGATMINSRVNMVAARGVTTKVVVEVMITNRAATAEEASREAIMINSRVDMVAERGVTTRRAAMVEEVNKEVNKKGTIAVEGGMEGMMI